MTSKSAFIVTCNDSQGERMTVARDRDDINKDKWKHYNNSHLMS